MHPKEANSKHALTDAALKLAILQQLNTDELLHLVAFRIQGQLNTSALKEG